MIPTQIDGPIPHQIITRLGLCGRFLHFKMEEKAGQRRVFAVLSKHEKMPQRELQDILGICSGSLSEVLSKMEADGLLEKTKSRTDGRQFTLRLTEEGKAVSQILEKEYLQKTQQMVSCFSLEEQKELLSMLQRLSDHWWALDQEKD